MIFLRIFKMSAFSRGCFPSNAFKIRTSFSGHFFFASRASQSRFFSSTFRISTPSVASKGGRVKPKEANISRLRPPKQNIDSPVAKSPHVYQSYAATLAQKSSPVLLYQAPSHTLYMMSCYSAASFCFAYAGWNFNAHYLNADPELATFVPIAFGGICFLTAAFGGWLLLGPARIVRSITAVPQRALSPNGQPSLKLEIELRKMFPVPFFPARKIIVSPQEVKLPIAFSGVDIKLSAAELRAMRIKQEKAEEKLIRDAEEYYKNHIWSRPFQMPFRQIKVGAAELFRALRQSWTREGFKYLDVKKQNYKLDVSRGWVLDGGRALERLVTVEKRLP